MASRQVCRHHQLLTAAGRVIGAPPRQGMRAEIIERYASHQRRLERGRDARVAHIGEMALAVYRQRMNLGVEGVAYRSRSPRKIDQHSARIDVVHPEPVRSKPRGNRVYIPRAWAETISKLLGGQPMVVVGRVWIFELDQQSVKFALPLWR